MNNERGMETGQIIASNQNELDSPKKMIKLAFEATKERSRSGIISSIHDD